MTSKAISADWRPGDRVLVTRLTGILSLADVEAWQTELSRTADQLDPGSRFKMLVDIRGYEVSEQDLRVHKVQREVIPLFLASLGFRVGFFDLYETEPPVSRDQSKGICVAVAHVHHDCTKMDRYNELLARPSERFFCDLQEAEAWLRTAPNLAS